MRNEGHRIDDHGPKAIVALSERVRFEQPRLAVEIQIEKYFPARESRMVLRRGIAIIVEDDREHPGAEGGSIAAGGCVAPAARAQSTLEGAWSSVRTTKVQREGQVDLIAMSTHGHRFIADVLFGTTVDKVRHLVKIPVLLLRAQ